MAKSMLGLDSRTKEFLKDIDKFLTDQYIEPKYFESEDAKDFFLTQIINKYLDNMQGV